ncbi:ankyrin repeat-containing domain protein [Bisporella sp. PMI_857]|nr:ankyrin repeat-containing domain protein [Bisporella sp. PMI_857]
MATTAPHGLSEDEIDDLLYFARVGDLEEFNAVKDAVLLREKIDLVGLLELTKDENSGNGPLHMAAANGHEGLLLDLCKWLSQSSPQNPAMLSVLNSQNQAGNTALHWAALNGHLPSVKVLLENGADPTITNHRGHDAIYEAELNDKADVVKWVLEEGGSGLEAGFGEKSGESGDGAEDVDEEMEEAPENGKEPIPEDLKADGKDLLSKVVEQVKDVNIKETPTVA